ncbi:hypothetical protein BD324DRAFT_608070 [Kockovaella imperatae]|uniref:Uncharacterized protein n=1 Tax=Kockovaella imperatae TaxID=4999 RepID=A0A1Y1UNH4_9TREE|nr:hypothetical protein BD324DRAFT_608070 [Kockovaella imperatae]ORX38675.1 hypothetical protein BD324DRAFT_608070 [Kockovaella imperatae]
MDQHSKIYNVRSFQLDLLATHNSLHPFNNFRSHQRVREFILASLFFCPTTPLPSPPMVRRSYRRARTGSFAPTDLLSIHQGGRRWHGEIEGIAGLYLLQAVWSTKTQKDGTPPKRAPNGMFSLYTVFSHNHADATLIAFTLWNRFYQSSRPSMPVSSGVAANTYAAVPEVEKKWWKRLGEKIAEFREMKWPGIGDSGYASKSSSRDASDDIPMVDDFDWVREVIEDRLHGRRGDHSRLYAHFLYWPRASDLTAKIVDAVEGGAVTPRLVQEAAEAGLNVGPHPVARHVPPAAPAPAPAPPAPPAPLVIPLPPPAPLPPAHPVSLAHAPLPAQPLPQGPVNIGPVRAASHRARTAPYPARPSLSSPAFPPGPSSSRTPPALRPHHLPNPYTPPFSYPQYPLSAPAAFDCSVLLPPSQVLPAVQQITAHDAPFLLDVLQGPPLPVQPQVFQHQQIPQVPEEHPAAFVNTYQQPWVPLLEPLNPADQAFLEHALTAQPAVVPLTADNQSEPGPAQIAQPAVAEPITEDDMFDQYIDWDCPANDELLSWLIQGGPTPQPPYVCSSA